MICSICSSEFINNLSGNFTAHIGQVHDINLENYTILTEYGGIAPICACGFCTNRPSFYRGKFKKYASGHDSQKWFEKAYIEKNGYPKCEKCGKDTKFSRKRIVKRCKKGCRDVLPCNTNIEMNNTDEKPLHLYGFNDPEVQRKIRENVMAKYGVDNISKLSTIKAKISESNRKVREAGGGRVNYTEEVLKHYSDASKRSWQNKQTREKTVKSLKKSLNTPEVKELRSRQQLERLKDPNYREKLYKALSLSCKTRFSKLHLSIIKKLSLREFGFTGEVHIPESRFTVDEINLDKKIILEINGDYVHANPKTFIASDIIALRGNKYLAKDKWGKDRIKKEFLESLGFKVIIIWESDDLEQHRKNIEKLLSEDGVLKNVDSF